MCASAFSPRTGRPRKSDRAASWLGEHQNGRLLQLIADSGRFEVFLTVDKNLPEQNKTRTLPFAIVVLRAAANSLSALQPFAPELLRRLPDFLPGKVYVLALPE